MLYCITLQYPRELTELTLPHPHNSFKRMCLFALADAPLFLYIGAVLYVLMIDWEVVRRRFCCRRKNFRLLTILKRINDRIGRGASAPPARAPWNSTSSSRCVAVASSSRRHRCDHDLPSPLTDETTESTVNDVHIVAQSCECDPAPPTRVTIVPNRLFFIQTRKIIQVWRILLNVIIAMREDAETWTGPTSHYFLCLSFFLYF